MITVDIESNRRFPAARGARGPLRLASVALVGSALLLAGCSSSHKAAKSPSSGPASGGAGSSASASLSAGEPVSSLPPGQIVANIEAPAIKAGFTIRLHRGQIIKVNAPAAKAGEALTFALDPASTKALTPIANAQGYYTGAADGVVTVKVSQAGAVIGTIAVTVWG